MTLLEVILAIAILGGSLAMLGELIRTGTRAAREGRLLNTAQLVADSVMAEMTAGITLPAPTQGVTEFGGFSWSYAVEVAQGGQQGLLCVAVTVRDSTDSSPWATTYTLMQLMIDPQFECDLETAAAAAGASTGSGSGSSSGGASGGGSSSTGAARPATGAGTGSGGTP